MGSWEVGCVGWDTGWHSGPKENILTPYYLSCLSDLCFEMCLVATLGFPWQSEGSEFGSASMQPALLSAHFQAPDILKLHLGISIRGLGFAWETIPVGSNHSAVQKTP